MIVKCNVRVKLYFQFMVLLLCGKSEEMAKWQEVCVKKGKIPKINVLLTLIVMPALQYSTALSIINQGL